VNTIIVHIWLCRILIARRHKALILIVTHRFQDSIYLLRHLYDLVMKRCINKSNFKLRAKKSVSLQFINEMELPTATNLHGNALPPRI